MILEQKDTKGNLLMKNSGRCIKPESFLLTPNQFWRLVE